MHIYLHFTPWLSFIVIKTSKVVNQILQYIYKSACLTTLYSLSLWHHQAHRSFNWSSLHQYSHFFTSPWFGNSLNITSALCSIMLHHEQYFNCILLNSYVLLVSQQLFPYFFYFLFIESIMQHTLSFWLDYHITQVIWYDFATNFN